MMKLGIFDSGLGGLLIAKAIHSHMPDLDIAYFGDTLHIPYGNRSQDVIYQYTVDGIEFLFSQGCNLVVLACNTSSAFALRKVQQEYLPGRHKGKNVLGVVVPTLEAALEGGHRRIGLIGTNYTVQTNIYGIELGKIDSSIALYQKAAPLLVPLVENEGYRWADPILEYYLEPLMEQQIEALILACTHYPFLKEKIRNIVGPEMKIISQDEIIPARLEDYLARHSEYQIDRNGQINFYVSDLTDSYRTAAETFYGGPLPIETLKMAA